MAECIIVRKGGGGSGSFKNILKTEIITLNTEWTVPIAKDQSFSVRIFGGGGAGNREAGGGGGLMNNGIYKLNSGDKFSIKIGDGGQTIDQNGSYFSGSGGTSTFGAILSAAGGEGAKFMQGGNGGSGGGGTSIGGIGYQFGGGG